MLAFRCGAKVERVPRAWAYISEPLNQVVEYVAGIFLIKYDKVNNKSL